MECRCLVLTEKGVTATAHIDIRPHPQRHIYYIAKYLKKDSEGLQWLSTHRYIHPEECLCEGCKYWLLCAMKPNAEKTFEHV